MMFGLTRREQRWKAEQQAAEVLLPMLATMTQAVAQVRVAEANTDAAELDRLRAQVERLLVVETAARNLVSVKGRFHTEKAFKALSAALLVPNASNKGPAL